MNAPAQAGALGRLVNAPALRSAAALRRLAVGSVVVNVLIVITGGVVRLTDSGLGCPTWPTCTDDSLVPTSANAGHAVVEFGNRMLTFVVAFFVLATWVVSMLRRQERTLATLAACSIPAQAVLGGITVRTHLNPWLVAAHFMLSMAILFVTFWLWWRVRLAAPYVDAGAAPRLLVRLTVLVSLATLVIGTLVTGAGPHAGDTDTSGKVHRIGLRVSSMAQLHADTVMVLIGLSVGVLLLVQALRLGREIRTACAVLIGVELAQGIIGYTQYFLHVPPALVALHMFGACTVWLAALNVLGSVEKKARTS
ncbi:MAG TPA: COX15/CtaA family protein [Jatrophihabitans sp.]